MKKVLILGAGMIAQPMVDYFVKKGFGVTITSRTKSKAGIMIKGKENSSAVSWSANNLKQLDQLVASHDLTVCLLPSEHLVEVARSCIRNKKNLVTTSRLSTEMKKLENEALKAGVLLLNEMGAEPGFDHMSAKRIIDKVHRSGDKIKEFYSFCGALPVPEEADNPFRYKFSCSPQGTLNATKNGARYLKNGQIVEISGKNVFKNPLKMSFPETGEIEVYPNRNSLTYSDIYNLTEAKTFFRGTIRYPQWCESMDVITSLGLVSDKIQQFKEKSYKEIVAEKIGVYPKNVKEKVAERFKIDLDNPAIISMDWLGYFDNDLIKIKKGSPLELTAGLMAQKMMLSPGTRDMVLMMHAFLIEKPNGGKEVIQSKMTDLSPGGYSSVSRTMAMPSAVAVNLILNGEISSTGVIIPVEKAIYEPVLNELGEMGISMKEKWGLPESEKLN